MAQVKKVYIKILCWNAFHFAQNRNLNTVIQLITNTVLEVYCLKHILSVGSQAPPWPAPRGPRNSRAIRHLYGQPQGTPQQQGYQAPPWSAPRGPHNSRATRHLYGHPKETPPTEGYQVPPWPAQGDMTVGPSGTSMVSPKGPCDNRAHHH